MSAIVKEDLLDDRLAKLETARSWSPRLLSRLETHIRSADDDALFRINPFTFARERNLREDEVIDPLLYATSLGLFGMDWLLLCPKCSCVVESLRNLEKVHSHYHCPACQVDLEASLDEQIAIAFTVSPEIRAVKFHRPEQLSAHDYCFKYGTTRDGVLPNGRPFVDVKIALTKSVSYLPPGETTRMTVEAKDAVAAGLAMRADIAGFNQGQPDRQLVLKIGIHKGAAIAVTLNERLDYFGQTVNVAARIQHLAGADEIYVSEEAYDQGVEAALQAFNVEAKVAKLRGIEQDQRVFCIPALTARVTD